MRSAPVSPITSPRPAGEWAEVTLLLAAATAACQLLDPYVSLTSQSMFYVLAVVVASYRLPLVPSVASAFGAVTLLNFFFVPPRFTFQVDSEDHLVALFTLLAVALVISHLGTALRRETDAALLNARRARQLQQLATDLVLATDAPQIVALGRHALEEAFEGPCEIGLLIKPDQLDLPADRLAIYRDGMLCCIHEAATVGPGTGRWPGLDAWYIPLGTKGQMGGAACVQNVSSYDHSGREHAQALCTLLAQAIGRLKLTESVRAAQEQMQWHQVQSTFLAAISHDLRTPLAAIMGAASSLQTQHDKLTAADRERLAASILNESRYLATLTENTLQLVRLDNAGQLDLDWVAMEEVVGAVLARVRQRDETRRIKSQVPPGLPLIKGDAVLLAQLLENLLDNALKYTPDGIELVVSQSDHRMHVAVEDRGPGIPPEQAQALFEPYRRNDRSGQRGAGLGLAVCKAVATAHGGTLAVSRRPGGGSCFMLTLPIETHQPERAEVVQ